MSEVESPPRRIEYVDLDTVPPAPRNPKLHDIAALGESIDEFGYVTPGVIDERTGLTVVGHGRTEALRGKRERGEQPPAGVVLAGDGRWLVPFVRGWASASDAHAEKFLVADNRHAELGGWDDQMLAQILTELPDMDGTGFDEDALGVLIAAAGDPADEHDDGGGETGDGQAARGELLGLAGVTVGEPDYTCQRGQRWYLGERHILVVVDPHRDHEAWSPLLSPATLFWPYPSPMAALVQIAEGADVVMVQPNVYLAGWVLTKWARVTGKTPVLADAEEVDG